jgi:CBS-domain-containing membrane protein
MFDALRSYLKRRWSKIRSAFLSLWKNYLYQSFLATIIVFIILLVLDIENVVVIASIGSSAFIIFTMPRNITARPRRLIGGHIVGLASGSLCALIPHASALASASVFALAVGISILLMVMLDFEHPPASGTALGVAMTGFSVSIMLALITSILLLSLSHYFSRRFLRDLT